VCDRCGRFLCVGCIEANVKGRVVCSECLPDWVPPEGYYYVPPWRFVLLSILTVGVYPWYWQYRVWKSIRKEHGLELSPFWRAFFGTITYTFMVKHMKEWEPKAEGLSLWLGAAYLLMNSLGIRDDVASFYIGQLAFVFLLPVVSVIAGNTPEAWRRRRAGFKTRHAVASLLGAMLWALILIGEILPDEYLQ